MNIASPPIDFPGAPEERFQQFKHLALSFRSEKKHRAVQMGASTVEVVFCPNRCGGANLIT